MLKSLENRSLIVFFDLKTLLSLFPFFINSGIFAEVILSPKLSSDASVFLLFSIFLFFSDKK